MLTILLKNLIDVATANSLLFLCMQEVFCYKEKNLLLPLKSFTSLIISSLYPLAPTLPCFFLLAKYSIFTEGLEGTLFWLS